MHRRCVMARACSLAGFDWRISHPEHRKLLTCRLVLNKSFAFGINGTSERARSPGPEEKPVRAMQATLETLSPNLNFTDEEYDRTARPSITLTCRRRDHCYRNRYRNAPGVIEFEPIEQRLAELPRISVPTIVLHGGTDGCKPLTILNRMISFLPLLTSADRRRSGSYPVSRRSQFGDESYLDVSAGNGRYTS